MRHILNAISISPFIGSNDYKESIAFYERIGFQVISIAQNMSVCTMGSCRFYLQNAQIKDWIENTMIFLEVENPEAFLNHLKSLDLKKRFPSVQLKGMVEQDWGKEFFLHDPSNILWHIGSFNQ